jgi:hypothetical protein
VQNYRRNFFRSSRNRARREIRAQDEIRKKEIMGSDEMFGGVAIIIMGDSN